MKILILGHSDSIGMALADPSQGWGNRLLADVEARTGVKPDSLHIRYYPWADHDGAYLEKTLAQGPFDAVVIGTTKVAFTIYAAHNRVRRVFGNRAGDWFKARVSQFDRKTLWQQEPGAKRSLNQLAHRVGRGVIGQAPDTSMEAVAESYLRTFARLARLEDTHVVISTAPPLPSDPLRRRPKLEREVERFRLAIREEAKRRSFTHFDPATLLPPPGAHRDALFIDPVHKTAALHAQMAERLASLVVAGS